MIVDTAQAALLQTATYSGSRFFDKIGRYSFRYGCNCEMQFFARSPTKANALCLTSGRES